MNQLVEVQFTSEYGWGKNMINKEDLDKLNSICAKPINASQMTKAHELKQTNYLYNSDGEVEGKDELLDLYYVGEKTVTVALNQFIALNLPVNWKVIGTIKELPEYQASNDLLHLLSKVNENMKIFYKLQQFNCKVGVHISDLGLLGVRFVEHLDDACTDDLQRRLDDGWRILAICPQPNQRRPDYILGRNNKED